METQNRINHFLYIREFFNKKDVFSMVKICFSSNISSLEKANYTMLLAYFAALSKYPVSNNKSVFSFPKDRLT